MNCPRELAGLSDLSVWGSARCTEHEYDRQGYWFGGLQSHADVSDTYFRVWIIEGRLDFADVDVTMEAEMIIVNGDDAHFTIGNTTHLYRRRAEIILHGHWLGSLGLLKCMA